MDRTSLPRDPGDGQAGRGQGQSIREDVPTPCGQPDQHPLSADHHHAEPAGVRVRARSADFSSRRDVHVPADVKGRLTRLEEARRRLSFGPRHQRDASSVERDTEHVVAVPVADVQVVVVDRHRFRETQFFRRRLVKQGRQHLAVGVFDGDDVNASGTATVARSHANKEGLCGPGCHSEVLGLGSNPSLRPQLGWLAGRCGVQDVDVVVVDRSGDDSI